MKQMVPLHGKLQEFECHRQYGVGQKKDLSKSTCKLSID